LRISKLFFLADDAILIHAFIWKRESSRDVKYMTWLKYRRKQKENRGDKWRGEAKTRKHKGNVVSQASSSQGQGCALDLSTQVTASQLC